MSHRKLFLGGLTKSTTTEQLFDTFSKYGVVVDAVVMERNGVPRGFGFVSFKDEGSLALVLADRVKVDGREVDIKRAVPEEEMEFAPTKVFVGGLSQSVDRNSLRAHFEQYGDVRDAVVMIDRTTGRSRGFGFVRFATPEAVEQVLSQPQLLDGQYVDVKRAQPAETLPPPKYPRSRQEEKAAAGRQTSRRRQAPEYELPAMDPMTANWMASLLSMPQMHHMQMPGFPLYPTAEQVQAFQGMAYPSVDYMATGMLPTFDGLAAAELPVPQLPIHSRLHVETEEPASVVPESSPLGDLSNVLQTALDGKSPTKTRPSPVHDGENSQNALFTRDMKTAMKEAGLASFLASTFPTAA